MRSACALRKMKMRMGLEPGWGLGSGLGLGCTARRGRRTTRLGCRRVVGRVKVGAGEEGPLVEGRVRPLLWLGGQWVTTTGTRTGMEMEAVVRSGGGGVAAVVARDHDHDHGSEPDPEPGKL